MPKFLTREEVREAKYKSDRGWGWMKESQESVEDCIFTLEQLRNKLEEETEKHQRELLGIHKTQGMERKNALQIFEEKNATIQALYRIIDTMHVRGFEVLDHTYESLKKGETVWNIMIPSSTFKAKSISDLQQELAIVGYPNRGGFIWDSPQCPTS
jgi:hypothetical protein